MGWLKMGRPDRYRRFRRGNRCHFRFCRCGHGGGFGFGFATSLPTCGQPLKPCPMLGRGILGWETGGNVAWQLVGVAIGVNSHLPFGVVIPGLIDRTVGNRGHRPSRHRRGHRRRGDGRRNANRKVHFGWRK